MESLRVQLLKDLIDLYADSYADTILAAERGSPMGQALALDAKACKEALYKFLEENFS